MPVWGDAAEASKPVVGLATLIGWSAVDCGELRVARYLESFAMTWIHMAIELGLGRRFAFAVMLACRIMSSCSVDVDPMFVAV